MNAYAAATGRAVGLTTGAYLDYLLVSRLEAMREQGLLKEPDSSVALRTQMEILQRRLGALARPDEPPAILPGKTPVF